LISFNAIALLSFGKGGRRLPDCSMATGTLFISTMVVYLFLDAFLQLHGGQTILKHVACPATGSGFRNDS